MDMDMIKRKKERYKECMKEKQWTGIKERHL